MNPPAIVLPASVVCLVEQEAHRLLCAHGVIAKAIASRDFDALEEAAVSLCVESSKVYGALALALREQRTELAVSEPASSAQSRKPRTPRKGLALVL